MNALYLDLTGFLLLTVIGGLCGHTATGLLFLVSSLREGVRCYG